MMKRNLIWTFWLALLLSVVGTFATSALLMKQWNRFVSYSKAEGRPGFLLQALANEIEDALNKKGDLQTLLLDNPLTEFGQVYLINSIGADVLGRPIPKEIAMPESKLDVIHVEHRSSSTPPILALSINSGGNEFFMIFRFDPPNPVWVLFARLGLFWVLVAALLVSGIISWWLALLVVRPIRHLALTSGLQDNGDFYAQISGELLSREDEIGELARELKTSGVKITHLLQQQKDFLRDVSHEVRTPLARLQVAAETVEFDAGDQRALNQIKQQVGVINQLVQDLLNLSQLDYLSSSQNFECIDPSALVHKCVESSQLLASLKQVSITVQPTVCRDVNIVGVPFLLDRALDNLMNNAIRHSPAHGKILVSCEIESGRCCFGVMDQGGGVPEDSLERIFEPFVRLDSSRQRQTGGFGLGLSIVRRIAELHKGSIVASNHPDGLVVKLMMPLAKDT
jgi:two-component system sensor histidine kinase CpxA